METAKVKYLCVSTMTQHEVTLYGLIVCDRVCILFYTLPNYMRDLVYTSFDILLIMLRLPLKVLQDGFFGTKRKRDRTRAT